MPSHREELGLTLVRAGADLRLSRLATLRRLEETSPDAPGRDLALASLQFGAWVDAVLLWAGWRLYPRDSLTRG